jgi:hypothetical protein
MTRRHGEDMLAGLAAMVGRITRCGERRRRLDHLFA